MQGTSAAPSVRETRERVDEHIIEIVSDSGEGAQKAGQIFGAVSARMGNGGVDGRDHPRRDQAPGPLARGRVGYSSAPRLPLHHEHGRRRGHGRRVQRAGPLRPPPAKRVQAGHRGVARRQGEARFAGSHSPAVRRGVEGLRRVRTRRPRARHRGCVQGGRVQSALGQEHVRGRNAVLHLRPGSRQGGRRGGPCVRPEGQEGHRSEPPAPSGRREVREGKDELRVRGALVAARGADDRDERQSGDRSRDHGFGNGRGGDVSDHACDVRVPLPRRRLPTGGRLPSPGPRTRSRPSGSPSARAMRARRRARLPRDPGSP